MFNDLPNQTPERTITEIPATVVHRERDISKQKHRTAAYCRVSTDSDEQLNSYKSQIEYNTKIINENPNWEMAGIFADEGLSAVSTKHRKQFNKMIRKCKEGKIDLIITKSVSRFARNVLDTIAYARMLKKLGVGVIFEKEGVNTLEMDDEILLTIFGSLAQAESESLSKNVAMGFRQSFKSGKVSIHYDGFLGYKKGADGKPEIVPEEAAIVKRIFHRYLAGDSVTQIKRDLESDGILTVRGSATWSAPALRYLLKNEKYAGDALLQKTYVSDVLTKQSKKNNGELPQYYIQNNHPAIIDRDVFNKVQGEIARRSAKQKIPSKIAKTEQSKYSGKYALNEALVCGECGTPYRRVTWTQHGEKRAVWRCISRLEHGKKFCKQSPTLDEIELHTAIMEVLSEVVARENLKSTLDNCVIAAQNTNPQTTTYLAAKRRLAELDVKFNELLKIPVNDEDADYFANKCAEIMSERSENEAIVSEYEANNDNSQQSENSAELFASETFAVTEYDESLVRQLIDTIRVQDSGKLQFTLKGGEQIDKQITNKMEAEQCKTQQSATFQSMN